MGNDRVLWDRVAMISVSLLATSPIIMLVWWLESRFGSLVAVMGLGLLGGAAFFMAGSWFNQRQAKSTMENVGDFIHELMQTEKSRQGMSREYARMERDAFSQRAKLEVLDAKRIDRLAEQRAKLLVSDQQSQQADNTEFWTAADIEYIEVE